MSDWLKDSFTFYKRHWLALLSIAVPIGLLQELIIIQLGFDMQLADENLAMDTLLWTAVIGMFISFFIQLFVIYYIQSVLDHQTTSFGALFSKAFAVMPFFIALNFLIALAMTFGLLVFIIPGIYIFIKLSLAQYFFLLDGQKIIASMRSSWKATRGYGWDLFLGILVVIILTMAPSFFITQGSALINSLINIISTCIGLLMTIFLYRAFDFVKEHPRSVD